jgi:hypothetical protein
MDSSGLVAKMRNPSLGREAQESGNVGGLAVPISAGELIAFFFPRCIRLG